MPSAGASSFTAGSSRGGTGTPKRLLDSGFGVRSTSQDEEEIGKPVEVYSRERVRVRHGEDRALRSAADRAREEEPRGALAPAREDEALQIGERRIRLVDLLLEPAHRLVGDTQPVVGSNKRNREVRTEVEELVLNAVEATRPTDERVELVDVADRREPRIELRDARAVA